MNTSIKDGFNPLQINIANVVPPKTAQNRRALIKIVNGKTGITNLHAIGQTRQNPFIDFAFVSVKLKQVVSKLTTLNPFEILKIIALLIT